MHLNAVFFIECNFRLLNAVSDYFRGMVELWSTFGDLNAVSAAHTSSFRGAVSREAILSNCERDVPLKEPEPKPFIEELELFQTAHIGSFRFHRMGRSRRDRAMRCIEKFLPD